VAGLSRREHEIAALLARRFSTGEIADRLFISRKTVSKHLEHIYLKLDVHRRSEVSRALGAEGAGATGLSFPPGSAGADALWQTHRDLD